MEDGLAVREVKALLINSNDLSDEEKVLAKKMWRKFSRKRRIEGNPAAWAAAIHYEIGRINFKDWQTQKTSAELFGVSESSVQSKSKEIDSLLRIRPFDERFCTEEVQSRNPLNEHLRLMQKALRPKMVEGFFEVKEKRADGIAARNLIDGKDYFIMERTALPGLKEGDVISSEILEANPNEFVFADKKIDILDPGTEINRKIINGIRNHFSGNFERAYELQRERCQCFVQYFGCTDPVFENGKKAEDSMNKFMQWRENQWLVPGKNKTPQQLYREYSGKEPPPAPELDLTPIHRAEQVGIIADEDAGQLIQPYYGHVKKLLSADYKNVPDYKGLVRKIVLEENFLPSFLIKKLIEKNQGQAIKVFKEVYPRIETIEDVAELFENRKDWGEKPKPTTIVI